MPNDINEMKKFVNNVKKLVEKKVNNAKTDTSKKAIVQSLNEDGTANIIINGEVYNNVKIRAGLQPQINEVVLVSMPNNNTKDMFIDLASSGGIYHKNLLHNWDFRNPVNQRGQSSYSGTGYTIDRWRLGAGLGNIVLDANGAVSNVYQSEGKLGDFLFEQYVENYKQLAGETVTFSMEIENVTSGYLRLVIIPNNNDSSTRIWSEQIGPGFSGIISAIGTITQSPDQLRLVARADTDEAVSFKPLRAKLELGSISTLANDPPADYGEQLALCKRYYRLWTTDTARTEALKEVGLMRVVSPTTGTVSINGTTYYYASADL